MMVSKLLKINISIFIIVNIIILSSLALEEWHIETVDKVGKSYYGSSSIAIDKSGFPQIAYSNYAPGSFKYAYKNENGWQISTYIQEPNVRIDSRSLKLDDEGHPHISFATKSGIKYAYGTFSGNQLTFNIESIDPQGLPPTALASSMGGKMPMIVYFGDPNKYSDTLMLSVHGYYGGWSHHIIDWDVIYGLYSSVRPADISLNLSGYPVIAAFVRSPNPYHCDLFYYQDKFGVTKKYLVDSIPFGVHVSMACKHDLNYFAYQGDRSLYYAKGVARQDSSSGSYRFDIYEKEEVKKFPGVALRSQASLAVDTLYQPVMCYRATDAYSKPYLEYALKDNSGWHFSTIDKRNTDGPSLMLDGFNRPFISYYDTTDPSNVVLKCAWREGITISHITPASGLSSNSEMQMDIFPSAGYTFYPNPYPYEATTVLLRKNGQKDILSKGAINVGTQIRCWFDLRGLAKGPWDVVVQVPYARPIVLKGGFNVGSSSGGNPSPSLGQPLPTIGWVFGRVVDQHGSGIPNAEIWVDNLPRSIMTDNLGDYKIALNPGTHRLAAKRIGYVVPPRGVFVKVGCNVSQDLVGMEYINLSSG